MSAIEKIKQITHREVSLYSMIYLPLRRSLLKIRRPAILQAYFKNQTSPKLHLGYGTAHFEGWLNTDLNPNNHKVAYLDAGKVFPFSESSFEYVFSEHLFEHLNLAQATINLKESFRVLKQGGKIRIAMPNLAFLLNLVQQNQEEKHIRYVNYTLNTAENLRPVLEAFPSKSPAELNLFVFNNFFRDWGHQIIYNFEEIQMLLEEIGFTTVQQFEVHQSNDSSLRHLEHH